MPTTPWGRPRASITDLHPMCHTSAMQVTYQESAQHVETDEVDDGKVAAACVLLPGVVIRLRVTQLSREAGQHDLLPGLARSTPYVDQGKKAGVELGVYKVHTVGEKIPNESNL